STTAYEDTSREILGGGPNQLIISFSPPLIAVGKEGISAVLRHDRILMQSHFLSDAFFDSLRSVRFTDRSNINFEWRISV
ncbi:MAG: hypothetical protein LBR79_02720, partial [Oscillospiraceae bacterium]|nr:hypothetical protein [Oscillospiraceae bacterium]